MEPIKVRYFRQTDQEIIKKTGLNKLIKITGTDIQIEQFFIDHETSIENFIEIKKPFSELDYKTYGYVLVYCEDFLKEFNKAVEEKMTYIEGKELTGTYEAEFKHNDTWYNVYFEAEITKEGWESESAYENAEYKYTFEKITFHNDRDDEVIILFPANQLEELNRIFK